MDPYSPDRRDPFAPAAAAGPYAANAADSVVPRPAGSSPAQPVYPAAAARPVPISRPIPAPARAARPAAHEEPAEDDVERFMLSSRPWLVSMIVHMTVLIVMGLLVVVTHQLDRHEVTAELPPPEDIYAEQLGEQLTDDSVLVPLTDHPDKGERQIITPQDLPRVDDAFAAPPKAIELTPGGAGTIATSTSNIDAPEVGMALTGRQHGSMKNVLLGAYGGNKLTEDSVLVGLEWLKRQQRADGTWSLTGPYKDGAIEENVGSATAMALLAFQGQGNTHLKGKYKDVVAKGWTALLKLQSKDGDFFLACRLPHQQLYMQAQCTIALCELFGMTNDSRYREPAERAVKYAVRIQDKAGGWRYEPGNESDTSVTGWFVMGLQSARMAKLEVPDATLKNVTRFLDAVALNDGREYTYLPGGHTTLAVTAEGLLCRQYLGWKQNDPRLVEGVKALNRHRVNYNDPDRDVYYWYYATQAAHHMENVNNEKIWSDWNAAMRQQVPTHQVKNGPEAGSWDPQGDRWGSVAGRLYVTCLSIYMLEVYYRHLPIYSSHKFMMAGG